MSKKKVHLKIEIGDCCVRFREVGDYILGKGREKTVITRDTMIVCYYAMHSRKITFNQAYGYVKCHGFKLWECSERVDIYFNKKKRAWICWCCGRLRIKAIWSRKGKKKIVNECMGGVILPIGMYIPKINPCKHYDTDKRKCRLKKCAMGRKIKEV